MSLLNSAADVAKSTPLQNFLLRIWDFIQWITSREVRRILELYFQKALLISSRDTDVHTVASLLKLYLRDLPEPVVPWSQYDGFLLCGQLMNSDEAKVCMSLE